VPLTGTVFRATSPRYRDLHRTAEITRRAEARGRFNTAEVGAVYVAREPDTACEELRRRLARAGETLERVHPRSVFVLDIHLRAVADIRTAEQLAAWGLTTADIGAAEMARCQEMASVAVQLGNEAVRWRSATGVGESLALYVDHLRPGSRIQIVGEHALTREMLHELQRGTPLTALLPELLRQPLLP
jgi:RES domain-containing protein